MFDAVRNNKRAVQIVLLLMVLPFAFFGVESYMDRDAAREDAAVVGDMKVPPEEFEQALRAQADRMREAAGDQFDPKMMETPEARAQVLEGLVSQRLMLLEAQRQHLTVPDGRLSQIIAGIPGFQVDGKFSEARFDQVAQARGYSRDGLLARIRQDMVMRQLFTGIAGSSFVPASLARRWAQMQQEQREVSEAVITPFEFIEQVKVTPEDVRKYYDDNQQEFAVPEQVKVEYLVLSEATLAPTVQIPEEEVRKTFEANQSKYMQGEERKARHILLTVDKDASPEQRKAVRAKAEELLKAVKANPARFAEVAKANSQDPGSKDSGGELGFFGRGTMVKSFEDAAFALKKGEISGIVETDFGFHIIQVEDVRGGQGKTLEEARPEITEELRKVAARRKFAELAESFSNTVYEQADSLAPAAEKFGLTVKTSPLIAKGLLMPAPFDNEKLRDAIFSDDAVKNRRNTQAIETAPNTLVSARVIDQLPPSVRSFEEVQADIEKKLRFEQGRKMAQERGEAALAKLKAGESAPLTWSPAQDVSRSQGQGPAAVMVRAIFNAPANQLPAYLGFQMDNGGYAVFRISAVKQPKEALDQGRVDAIKAQLEQTVSQDDFAAYLSGLRREFPVKLNTRVLEANKTP
ncbi:SurA N-terminal domain-containing protein [Methyloversatilis thermotolerans]|uniref:SurA N-terminal domain-containing protein n=1 Tax=Methyloversatilis thermotolerans TaxID=1346290 RepID=UPI000374705C|nr:SurA N-terminal domain-containing protein [Methyloversatilis thermotolerans]